MEELCNPLHLARFGPAVASDLTSLTLTGAAAVTEGKRIVGFLCALAVSPSVTFGRGFSSAFVRFCASNS